MKAVFFWLKQRLCTAITLTCLGTMLVACGGGGGGDSSTPQPTPPNNGTTPAARAKWTYLVYMAADNNLSEFATSDIEEMMAAKSSADVQVVVQVEQNSPRITRETRRGTITHGKANLISLGRNVDMTDKGNLADFIKWGKQNFPADRYVLMLWSHGGGWKANKSSRGVLQDETSAGDSLMSVQDVAWAAQDAGGVDILNFDACLMGMYEVAYELRKAAKVLVASEEVTPGTGAPYDRLINHTVENPSQDAVTLGKTMVTDFAAYYRGEGKYSVTISAIDLSHMEALHAKVRESAAVFLNALPTERLQLEAAVAASISYNYPNNHDLIGFATELSNTAGSANVKAKALELADSAKSAVLSVETVSVPGDTNLDGSRGLAIYLPAREATTQNELQQYHALLSSNAAATGSTSWSDFVTPLVTGASGQWQELTQGSFRYRITWDNPEADLDLVINEPNEEFAGPAYGVNSSNNSVSSEDSFFSGKSEEIYTARQTLQKGEYDAFVRYNGCQNEATTCGETTVSVYLLDPSQGNTQEQLLRRQLMRQTPALELPAGTISWTEFLRLVNTVSQQNGNWVYVNQTQRALPDPSVKSRFVGLPKSKKSLPTIVK